MNTNLLNQSSMPAPQVKPERSNTRRAVDAPKQVERSSSADRSNRFSDELDRVDRREQRGRNQQTTERKSTEAPTRNDARADSTRPAQEPKETEARAAELAANGVEAQQQAPAEVPKKQLKQLGEVLSNTVDASPVIAFITGQLEKLDPKQIPGLVSGNEFLSDALSNDSLQKFFDTPISVQDLVSKLDLPQGVLAAVSQLGIDINVAVSPRQFLRGIGVDDGRVFAELTQLKDNLPSQGIAPYLQRAAALRASAGTADQMAQQAERVSGHIMRDTAPAVSPNAASTTMNAQDPVADTPRAIRARQELAAQQNGLADGALLQAMNQQQMLGGNFNPMGATPIAGADASNLLGSTVMAEGVPVGMPVGLPLSNVEEGVQNPLAQQLGQGEFAQQQTTPNMRAATFDRFHQMGQQLQGQDAVVQLADDGAPQMMQPTGQLKPGAMNTAPGQGFGAHQTLVEAMVAQRQGVAQGNMASAVQVDPQAAAENVGESMPQLVQQTMGNAQQISQAQRSDLGVNPFLQQTRLSQLPVDGGETLFDSARLTDRLAVDELPRDLMNHGDQPAGEQSGQGFERGQSDLGLASLSRTGQLGAAAESAANFNQVVQGSDAMTTAERTAMVQKIMDQAQAIVRDGGGTVSIDMGTPELGRMQLAVQLNQEDQRVDLKIIAGSDRVREVLVGEMNRLRDALTVNNFNLGEVQVGVEEHVTRHEQNFAGHDQQGFQDGFDQQQDGQWAPWSRNTSNIAEDLRMNLPRMATAPLMQNTAAASGRLEVRV